MSKKIGLFFLALFIIAGAVGLINRQAYTDITAKENWQEHFRVALLPPELSPMIMEHFRAELPNSNYILRVRATGEIEFLYGTFHQHVEVLEVYRGGNIATGDEIEIVDFSWFMSMDKTINDRGYRTANVSFVNFLVEDDEYLIFLDSRLEHKLSGEDKIYHFGEYLMPPIFNYEDKEHVFPPLPSENERYVPLTEVKGNEIFVENEEMLEDWTNLKHELLEMFPRD